MLLSATQRRHKLMFKQHLSKSILEFNATYCHATIRRKRYYYQKQKNKMKPMMNTRKKVPLFQNSMMKHYRQHQHKAAFILYWTSLVILLKRCLFPACYLTTAITNVVYKGSQLVVTMKCPDQHQTTWKLQPNCNHYSIGNLTSASALFSANTF